MNASRVLFASVLIALTALSPAAMANRAARTPTRARAQFNNRHPIILVHGIAPFDIVHKTITGTWSKRMRKLFRVDDRNYFKSLQTTLQKQGYDVHTASIDFAGSNKKRAQDLHNEIARVLKETGADKVHIIGHSMGGNSGRRVITEFGNSVTVDGRGRVSDVVVSMSSIGTPHNGTPFADAGLKGPGDKLVTALGGVADGLRDLTTDATAAFNREVEKYEAHNGVVYQVVGTHQSRDKTFLPLVPSHDVIAKALMANPRNDADKQGHNDGLVPLTSQLWTRTLRGDGGVTKAVRDISHFFPQGDHLNQTGWADVAEGGGLWRSLFTRKGRRAKKAYEAKIREGYSKIANSIVGIEQAKAAAAASVAE